jgi:hypothetical protein
LDSLPVVERVDPLALTAEERSFISLLGPPLITGPGAVKRLANSYGLLVATTTARSGSMERSDLQPVPDLPPHPDCYPYRAALVLLAAVIGYPMLGCAAAAFAFRTLLLAALGAGVASLLLPGAASTAMASAAALAVLACPAGPSSARRISTPNCSSGSGW